jgi:hypothetical protein
MTPEPKRPHVVIGFLDRCTAWYKRLPLLWQIIVAIALVVGGVLAAPYLFHLIIGLVMDFCIFGLLILFMIGMVGSLFGKGHRNNHDDDWWDEMMDDARGNGPHHVDFHF